MDFAENFNDTKDLRPWSFIVQVVARAFERAGEDRDALVNVVKIARGRGARSAGDRNVILSAQASLEALHPRALLAILTRSAS